MEQRQARQSTRFTGDGRRLAPEERTHIAPEERVRIAPEERPVPRPYAAPVAPEKTTVQKAAATMGAANLAIGALGFVAPVVRGTEDRVLNTHTGKLLGIFAINPPHALVHLGMGLWGLAAQRSEEAAQRHMKLSAGAFGALAAAGALKVRGRKGIHKLFGLAINRADNFLHAAWAAADGIFAAKPRLGQTR